MKKIFKGNLKRLLFLVISIFAILFVVLIQSCKQEETSTISHRDVIYNLVKRSNFSCLDENGNVKTYDDFINKYGYNEFNIIETFSTYNDFLESSTISVYLNNYKQVAEELKNITNFTLKLTQWDLGENDVQKLRVLFIYYNEEYYAVSILFFDDSRKDEFGLIN